MNNQSVQRKNSLKLIKFVGLGIISMLFVAVIASSASATILYAHSEDIQTMYSSDGSGVAFRMRNNFWDDTLFITLKTNAGCGYMSVPPNTWGQWSNWTEYIPHPVYITAYAGGDIYIYEVP